MVNVVFQESVRQVLEKIKYEPFFKWLETLQSATTTSTAITIRNRDILRKIVGTYGIIWTNLSEKEN